MSKVDFASLRVLVIDDDADARDILRMIFETQGSTVFTAVNGREGFDIARTQVPDLIISDIAMPGVNGWDFIRLIRSLPQLGTIPTIALTAFTTSYYERRAKIAGFRHFMTKPINPLTFVSELEQVIPDIKDK